MRDPRAVEPVGRLPDLVLLHLPERDLVDLGVAARRDERRHPADRVRAPPVARLHEQLGVRAHERHGHRDLRPVGQHLAPAVELLDQAEDVVPAPGVQRGDVVAKLVEDLVHLERREHGLDQHGRADRAAVEAELVLGEHEGPAPEPRLAVALELREIEVRPGAAVELLARVVEHAEAEVEQARGDRLAVHLEVALGQMPAARADDQRRDLVVQPVALLPRVERDRLPHRVAHVSLAVDDVGPRRRARVLEVGHEDLRARVERVDHHLALDRAR